MIGTSVKGSLWQLLFVGVAKACGKRNQKSIKYGGHHCQDTSIFRTNLSPKFITPFNIELH
jgi:hypothetical protein